MTAPSLNRAHFWRWLLGGAVLFAAVALLEMAALLRLFAVGGFSRASLVAGGFSIPLVELITALAGAVAYALYAVIFLTDYFFFQRFERSAERRLVPLWLLSIFRLGAGIFVAWLLRIACGAAARDLGAIFWNGTLAMSWTISGLTEVIPNAVIGAGFGFLLWSLQRSYSDLLRDRAPSLLRAHVVGGAVGGALLALAGVASSAAFLLSGHRAPAALWLIVLGLAVLPHLILTWRAMHPALLAGAREMTGAGVFIVRLVAALVPVAAPALYLIAMP